MHFSVAQSIRRPFILAALLLAAVIAVLLVQRAAAQAPTPSDDEVNAIAKQLYCPVCENVPLDVCPTVACSQWRDLIRQKLAEGDTEQEIKDYFVANYGDRVLAEPPRTGFNWLVYLLPPVFILAGVYIVYRVLTSARKQAAKPAAPPAVPPDDPYLAQVEEELKRRSGSERS
ncbi:MAG TPA: cytochrome c-type biogenesis protein [Anaerolineaceae bacterium]|nr:cytochrome c-type biogenesis protein [Anaerolineaceae bacterium]